MSNESLNPWKLATIGILLVGATAAATMLIVGRDFKTELPDSPTAQISETQTPATGGKAASTVKAAPVARQQTARPSSPPRATYPSQSVMEECNRYASEEVNSKTEEVLKNAALGAAIGAAVGAAGGAIAGGGKGAGKGAAIGGVAGVAGGSLYGLNETKSHDAEYQAAYASCMRTKGY
ncbi:MAG: hypothetical protein ABIT23_03695 [Nitrosospira sp.]